MSQTVATLWSEPIYALNKTKKRKRKKRQTGERELQNLFLISYNNGKYELNNHFSKTNGNLKIILIRLTICNVYWRPNSVTS